MLPIRNLTFPRFSISAGLPKSHYNYTVTYVKGHWNSNGAETECQNRRGIVRDPVLLSWKCCYTKIECQFIIVVSVQIACSDDEQTVSSIPSRT